MQTWNHGTSYGYKIKGCRCDACRKASSKVHHDYYIRRGRDTQIRRIQGNPARRKQEDLKYRQRLKFDVLCAYGGNPPQCACCGEQTIEFLTLDHVNGDGRIDRERVGKSGNALYSYLRTHDFPLGYRVLCMNCNSALGFYGYCPHYHKANWNKKARQYAHAAKI